MNTSKYVLPINPSPNLPSMASIYWYPSICLFEGTEISEGRGTDNPFCNFGHPSFTNTMFAFTPTSKIGAKEPKFKNQTCYGWNVYNADATIVLKKINNKLQLQYLMDAYKMFSDKNSFFIKPKTTEPTEYFFNKLVGNSELMEQMFQNMQEKDIRKSWQTRLNAFKKIRKKYLLYKDFE